jgi:hypothetical protein
MNAGEHCSIQIFALSEKDRWREKKGTLQKK